MDYDVVMLMSERVAIPYAMLQRLFGRRAATVYVSAHSSRKQAQLVHALGLSKGIDCVVSNTHAQREFLLDDMGIPADCISCVLYAVDEQFFTPGTESRGYILSAGGIAGRDYATFFEAVRDLPINVKIAAGGRFYGPSANRRLPPKPSNIEMLPATNSAGMRELYRNAALVIVPLCADRKDAAGCSVVLEAMCCGKPVIASHTRGMEDYIRDGETGSLAACGDDAEMSRAISLALERADERAKWGRNARAEIEECLSLRHLVEGLAKSVNNACDKRTT
jgi:glycosyltransferase involved in cell wall biosynthesis